MRKGLMIALLCAFNVVAQAQQFLSSTTYRERNKIDDNIGIITSLGVNATHGFISGEGNSRSAKGALSLVPTIGVFYQKGLNENVSIRLGFSLGVNNYAYKYAQPFDSLTADEFPTKSSDFGSYKRVKNSSAFVMPQIDIGYLLKPIKEIYLIELRAGAGLHAYLSEGGDTVNISKSQKVRYPKSAASFNYYDKEEAQYGNPNAYGTFVGTAYIGLRWQKTFSNLLNHSAIGIQAIIPISLSDAGYSELTYMANSNPDYLLGKEKVKMGLMSFGIRYTYSIL